MSRRPIDVPTRETVEFLAAHVSHGASLLEVGCGRGEVARLLGDGGYRVVAIDAEPDAVARARELGVDARLAAWPEYSGPGVDAIAFTRSLHHIGPLDAALERVQALLQPRGMLLIEDFAFDTADTSTIDWFVTMLRTEAAAALLQPVDHQFVTQLLTAADPHVAWHRAGGHDIHDIGTMRAAVSRHFTELQVEAVPYLYRYLVPVLGETSAAAEFAASILQAERAAITSGRIAAIGRRIVAQNQPLKNSRITPAS